MIMAFPGLPHYNFLKCHQWLLALLCCCCLLGCVEDKQKIIAEKVAERVNDFSEKKKATCRQNLLEKAERMVDSLLLAEAQQTLQDSLSRRRPFKPNQPPSIPAIDSLTVKPLFDGPPKQ